MQSTNQIHTSLLFRLPFSFLDGVIVCAVLCGDTDANNVLNRLTYHAYNFRMKILIKQLNSNAYENLSIKFAVGYHLWNISSKKFGFIDE